MGDDQITYLGYSYGTILGAIYADLFPDKVRAMVLDGAVDPTTGVDATGEQHGGTYGDQDFQQAFARFAAACAAATGCSAGPDAKALLDQVRAQAEAAPLAAPTVEAEDGRKLTIGLFETGVASALYDTASWPFLSVALRDAANGDGSALIRLADNLNRRKADGTWENLFDAFRAISCADFPARPTAADVTATYTAIMGTGEDVPANMPNPACQGWAPTADPLPVVTKAATEHPVLVLGTKGDPATPYANAAAMASSLGNAVELTWEGDGHTAFPKTKCVNDAVGRYLTDLTVPPAGTDCPAADGGGSSTAGSAYALDRDLLRRQIEDGFKQNGTPKDLAECIARPLAEDLDENQIVHFFLGLDATGLNDKLNAVASSCGGTFGSGTSGSTGSGSGERRRVGPGPACGSAADGDRLRHVGEEVVALVVDDDEGREVLDLDLPDRLHAELGVLQHLDLADAVLGQAGGRAADRAEVEAAVALAGVGDLLAAVALGQHHEAAAVRPGTGRRSCPCARRWSGRTSRRRSPAGVLAGPA